MPNSLNTASTIPAPASGRRLAAELRRCRELAGMSGERAAQLMHWSPSKISRIECGQTCVRPADISPLLRLYKVPDPGIQSLTVLAERSWRDRLDPDSDRFDTDEVLAWAPQVLPLLLRTGAYHEAVLRTLQTLTATAPSEIRDMVNRNLIWQARLETETDPIRVRAVLDESVLSRQFGSPAVMAGQVRRLAELAVMGNVELGVLSYGKTVPSWIPAFTHVRFRADDGPSLADEVVVPMLDDWWKPEIERQTWFYRVAWGQLAEAAGPAAGPLARAFKRWS